MNRVECIDDRLSLVSAGRPGLQAGETDGTRVIPVHNMPVTPLQVGAEERERNRRLVIDHFDDFVDKQDLSAIDRNMAADFYDHDGPGGGPTDRDGDKTMMAGLYRMMMPDLRVEVVDSVAEGDKVMVHNIWTGTNAETGARMEFHGFVLWRIANGKIVERWATVTPLREFTGTTVVW